MKVKMRENKKKDVLRLIHNKENIAHSVISRYSLVAETSEDSEMHKNAIWNGYHDITETGFLLDDTGYYISSRENIEWWKGVLLLYQVYLDSLTSLKNTHGEEKVLRVLKENRGSASGIESMLQHKIKVLKTHFSKKETSIWKKTSAKIWNSK